MQRLGIVGCGSIGTALARFAQREVSVGSILVLDTRADRADALAGELSKAKAAMSAEALVAEADLVVEAASQDAARSVVPMALRAGKDVMVLSVGVFADAIFLQDARQLAEDNGQRIYVPSGAIAGIDGLRAASMAGVNSVTLVTTKPPAALGRDVGRWTMLFDGPAAEAVQAYPQNVNVAACLSLAGIGFDRTRVQVVADPLATRNQHKIIIEGEFGRIRMEIDNMPSPDNAKTSWLASLSAMASLRRILDPIQLGT